MEHQNAGNSEEINADGDGEEKQPLLVIAKHKFQGKNNDELSFNKNDVITVTQKMDGGWWEGSLDSRIGWFPADFVGIIKKGQNGKKMRRDGERERNGDDTNRDMNEMELAKLEASRTAFRAQLVQEFITKETENIAIFGKALEGLRILSSVESNEIPREAAARLAEFIKFKANMTKRLEEQAKLPMHTQKIGKLFLDMAPTMRSNLRDYCGLHCDLMEFLSRTSGQIEKQLAASSNGPNMKGMVLGLSLVFRHVQKYASVLQEIERNTPETHPDRGNLQRAAQVYLDFHEECELIRRQREAQLDLMQSGILQENFGADFEQKLGHISYTGKVGVSEGGKPISGSVKEHEEDMDADDRAAELDRCIAIFSSTILLLHMQMPSGRYVLKNRFGTANLAVKQIDSKNAVQLRRDEDVLIVRSVGKKDYQQMLEALRASTGLIMEEEKNGGRNNTVMRRKKHTQNGEEHTDGADSIARKMTTPTSGANTIGNIRVDHQLEMILPDGILPHSNGAIPPSSFDLSSPNCSARDDNNKVGPHYSGWSLRPIPPHRAEWLPSVENAAQQIKLRKGLSAEEQEDALLLKIVEGYCLGGPGGGHSAANIVQCCAHGQRQRNSAESCHSPCGGGGTVRRAASYPDHNDIAASSRPQLIVAEQEKLFVEEMEGDQLVVKERSLVDTVYSLKDQLMALTKEVGTIAKALEHEQRARRRMEEYIRQSKPASASAASNNNLNTVNSNNGSITNQSPAQTTTNVPVSTTILPALSN